MEEINGCFQVFGREIGAHRLFGRSGDKRRYDAIDFALRHAKKLRSLFSEVLPSGERESSQVLKSAEGLLPKNLQSITIEGTFLSNEFNRLSQPSELVSEKVVLSEAAITMSYDLLGDPVFKGRLPQCLFAPSIQRSTGRVSEIVSAKTEHVGHPAPQHECSSLSSAPNRCSRRLGTPFPRCRAYGCAHVPRARPIRREKDLLAGTTGPCSPSGTNSEQQISLYLTLPLPRFPGHTCIPKSCGP